MAIHNTEFVGAKAETIPANSNVKADAILITFVPTLSTNTPVIKEGRYIKPICNPITIPIAFNE